MTITAATLPQLSCYTTNLVAQLENDVPDMRRRIGRAIRLAVRTDLPPGELAFSHHTRVDITPDGRGLAYRAASDWERTRAGLLAGIDADGSVLAVGNTAHLTWSPAYGRSASPHWLLVRAHRDGRWSVTDHFASLTPHGEQEPFEGWLDDEELAKVLTPLERSAVEVAWRDRMALGQAIEVPAVDQYRWLRMSLADVGPHEDVPDEGTWLTSPGQVLSHVCTAMMADPSVVARYTDDLWAAGCHYAHRNHVLVTEGLVDPDAAHAATAAWADVPKTLRFAAQSAARGRPRASLIEQTFARLVDVIETLDTGLLQEG